MFIKLFTSGSRIKIINNKILLNYHKIDFILGKPRIDLTIWNTKPLKAQHLHRYKMYKSHFKINLGSCFDF